MPLLIVCVLATPGVSEESPDKPAAGSPKMTERDQRMEWWREARFGMFVHWGLYSGLAGTWEGKAVSDRGGMEWIQNNVGADTDTYAEAAIPLFKPKQGFAEEWARLAKQAGCKYVVFTTKHHDGFALHDSHVSDYDAGSVLERDLVREIVDACRAQGLRVGFYHSVIDWHHDQYGYANSQQLPHPLKGKPYPNGERDHSKYVEFLHKQVDELMNNYGPVDIVWWDYSAIDYQGDEAWDAFNLMAKVRKRQPGVIMNNRLFRIPEAGWKSMGTAGFSTQLDPKYGDFITPEQHVPDEGMPGVDWETCMTMNTTWGYSEHDHAWKSTETLVRNLVDIVSKGGNYLLNIGPTGDGTIPPESVERMQAVGDWMATNGQAIYGATISGVASPAWGRVTQSRDGAALYLCVFDAPEDGRLELAGVPTKFTRAMLLGSGEAIELDRDGEEIRLTLPVGAQGTLVPVVQLTFAGE
ncbi:alpha-L-fucosidase [Posidoniimonas polymericola]|uniref:alpha-L-fucosidase n=1 Tax=Posidoniimonas polymericola TaxID=2528002 RepID=UPI0018D4AB0D|nr:alpha-L-fucosidase [Posidoniimonas polymericola]